MPAENNNKATANSANKAYDLILVPNLIDLLYFHKSGSKKHKVDKRKKLKQGLLSYNINHPPLYISSSSSNYTAIS